MPYPSPADEPQGLPLTFVVLAVATIALVGLVAALCVAWAVM